MKSLLLFIDEFLKNKGHHVFLSLFIAKICGFIGSLAIIRILPANEFGTVSIVASVFFIFLSFSGLGSHQSLLRYGSLAENTTERRALSSYLLKNGFIYQIIISLLFLITSFFYIDRYEDVFLIFVLFSVRLVGIYFLNHIQAEFRISGDNKTFAKVGNVVNIVGVVILICLSYYFGLKGYLYAVAFTPFLALFWFRKAHFDTALSQFKFTKKEIWNFGLHAAGTALLSDALFSADILILSFLMNETAVAGYKVGLLIPLNITFLAASFMQSDYTLLAKNSSNKEFLKNYIWNFYKLFIPISAAIFLVGTLFRTEILTFFFGAKYLNSQLVFLIFLGGFALNMLLRNLYGTLLSAVGMMKINTMVSIVTLILLVVFAFLLVNKFGIVGMAISLSTSLLLGGSALCLFFYRYWKDLK